MGKLYFFISLARAGKTTYSKHWQEQGKNRVVLSFDDFRFVLTGQRYFQDAEDFVRASVLIAARALLRNDYDVLLDDTFSRHHHVQEALYLDKNAHAIILHTPIEVCKQRAIDTGQPDLLEPLDRMMKNLEVTLPMIVGGDLNLKSFEEIGPEHRWLKSGYWGHNGSI